MQFGFQNSHGVFAKTHLHWFKLNNTAMYFGINKGTVPQLHIVCVSMSRIRFYDQFHNKFSGTRTAFLIAASITKLETLTLWRIHKQRLKHFRIGTNVFCLIRMTKKESNNIRIERENESNNNLLSNSIGQCAHVLLVSLSRNKKKSKPFNKRSQQLEMLSRQIYKLPLQVSSLCCTMYIVSEL